MEGKQEGASGASIEIQPLRTTREDEKRIIKEEEKGIRPQVLGKGSLEQVFGEYTTSQNPDLVLGYELYTQVGDHERALREPQQFTKGLIKGAHFQRQVEWQGKARHPDLSDAGDFGDTCEHILLKTIDLVQALGGEYVNIHLGTIPSNAFIDQKFQTREELVQEYKQERGRRIIQAAERIVRADAYAQEKGVSILVENDPIWPTNDWVGIGQGILSDPQALTLLLKYIPKKVGIMLDEEHLYRAAVFQNLWEWYLEERTKGNLEPVGKEALEAVIKKASEMPLSKLKPEQIFPFVEEMIDIAGYRIYGLHVCGWDLRNDSYLMDLGIEGASLMDAHLPPRTLIKEIEGEGITLLDTIDHRHTLRTVMQRIGPEHFKKLRIILEYNREDERRRYYSFTAGHLIPREKAQEFAISARGIRHLISGILRSQSQAERKGA